MAKIKKKKSKKSSTATLIQVKNLMAKGLQNHQQGNLKDAESCYRETLRIDPNNVNANNLLGVIYLQVQRYDVAIPLFQKAIEIKPDFSEAYYNMGSSLQTIGSLDDAVKCYHKVIEIKPDYAEAHNNLGNTLQALGRLDDALSCFYKAIEIKPDYAEMHYNLGSTLQALGRLDEALPCFHRAIEIKPDYAKAHNNLGNALKELGQLSEAISHFHKAISIKPNYTEAYSNLGTTLQELGKPDDAVKYYQKAIDSFHKLNEPKNQGAELTQIHSNLLLGLNYYSENSEETVFTKHLEWEKNVDRSLFNKESAPTRSTRKPNNPLKIGYVSPDFKTHSVAYFFEPLIASHDRGEVEIYCYYNDNTVDKTTLRLKKASNHWRSIVNLSDDEVANLILQDNIDILVDLAGHTAGNRLPVFTYKPAPIQVTWLGYPNTTGLSSMDYRFTDGVADPIGESDEWYTEELIRLPNGFLCYQGDDQVNVESKLPCRERGHITFGSFNNLAKITPKVVHLWTKILNKVPNSHLLLKTQQLADKATKLRFLRLFEEEGISKERLELYAKLPKKEDHLALYSQIDIGLDPFPFNGVTTTCEALWMGVPTITLLGDRHAGRVCASIMKHVDLSEFIAEDLASYVELAVQHANDPEHLSSVRQGLRTRMKSSKLCNASSFTMDIENAYKKMWKKYMD